MQRRNLLMKRPSSGGYLLDSYSADYAYSLRKLKTGITYACRVRRTSDSATTDVELESSGSITLSSTVSAGGTLGSWVGVVGAVVTTWYDQSGNSNDCSQSDTGRQPFLVAAGVLITDGSIAAMDFTNSEFFELTTSFSSGGDVSYFGVYNPDNFSSGQALFGNVAITQQLLGWTTTGSALSFRAYDGAATTVSDTDSAVQRLVSGFAISNTGMYLYKDGSLLDSDLTFGTMSAITSQRIGIASYNPPSPTANSLLNGKLQEFIMFKTDQTSNRTAIETNINNHYSIF